MATTSAKSPTPALPMEPWQYLALVARCAQETGIEVDRAFRFMGAVTLAMQQQHATPAVAPATPPSSSTPQ